MESSPSKRRKTSLTTSVPADAPATPSRIPVRADVAKTLSGRPSFASPTKASIARHNPHLLSRPSSSGAGAEKSGSQGRNLDDVFARALGETRPGTDRGGKDGADFSGSTTQENEKPDEDRGTPVAAQPKSRGPRSSGGGLSAKPKRMSFSPLRRGSRRFSSTGVNPGAREQLQENINPFKKTGLRRSPIAAQAAPTQAIEEDINPFEKKGLRRSPISSQVPQNTSEKIEQSRVSTTPTAPLNPHISSQVPQSTFQEPEQPEVLATPTAPVTSHISPRELRHSTLQEREQPEISTTPTAPLNSQTWTPKDPPPQGAESIPLEEVQEPVALPAAETTKLEDMAPPSMPTSQAQQPVAPEPQHASSDHPEEPQLPPTPTQLGLLDPVVTTPPAGIHDTPSRRARKGKDLKNKPKSSPLKPKAPSPAPDAEPEPRRERLSEDPLPEPPKRRKSARFSIIEDPHAAKKKSRDDLLDELQKLQADVALANRENERLRQHYESKRPAPGASSNPEELLDLLLRASAPEPPSQPDPKPKSVFKSIGAFLPFSSRRKRTSGVLPAIDKRIPSHLPVAVDNPLPYLQAFSPLTYTSNITLLPLEHQTPDSSPQEDRPVLQQHLITASHPSGLFTSRLTMIVDSSLPSISSLSLDKLPSCAEKELGHFLKEQSSRDGVLTKDIGLVCWAMGRWAEVSILRARFWCAVEQELGTPEARQQSIQKRKKRKHHHAVTEDDDAPLDAHDEAEGRKQTWTRKQLMPHMGRTAMELATDTAELRFEWKIKFDWTGEADSSISASVRLPKRWQEADDRKSLVKVPELFARLLKQKGPLGAVRTVVGLLMPEA